jgi:hypothetical protein
MVSKDSSTTDSNWQGAWSRTRNKKNIPLEELWRLSCLALSPARPGFSLTSPLSNSLTDTLASLVLRLVVKTFKQTLLGGIPSDSPLEASLSNFFFTII